MMRKVLIGISTLAVAIGFLPALSVPPAAAGALASANVDYQLTIPDPGLIGGKRVGKYLYTTGANGVHIYDVSAGSPTPVGALALPHFENEYVDTNGKVLIIAADHFVAGSQDTPGAAGPRDPRTHERIVTVHPPVVSGPSNVMYVIDVSNPQLPSLMSVTFTRSGHTATCIQNCSYVWLSGSDEGVQIMDLRDPAHPRALGFFGPASHNILVDQTGIAWISGWEGLYAYTTNNPAAPTLVSKREKAVIPPGATRDPKEFHNNFIIHNSIRPRARLSTPAKLADARIDPGEVVLVTEENWSAALNGECKDDGQFQTGWFHTVHGRPTVEKIDTFSIGQGTITDASPAKPAAAVACSSHWFDEHNGIVADAWYEQGLRFLDVRNPRDIRQIGYYIPVNTEVWQGMFNQIGGDLWVYTFDVGRGLDVLKLNLDASGGGPAVFAPRLQAAGPSTPDPKWGYACRVMLQAPAALNNA